MELHKGTTLSKEERKNIKCRKKWNAVRKAYSEFIGKPYILPPVYTKTVKGNKSTDNTQTKKQNGGDIKNQLTRTTMRKNQLNHNKTKHKH